ncbi:hypothetical protein FPQ18DRAFT_342243 [Pyronema domesticum]|uniref:Uncharacterized protein n=1 Tax=Pyronema omphalodes (strain CBS 100304) TaxID=1076935 RepID=U4LGE1_PYROM|nr:hypothetical protein FPQ18DRAFT_342243 [Pyronema domesticum]CCX10689.1 Protein of unknown function [Pyronema omphalodes CBS 100304]
MLTHDGLATVVFGSIAVCLQAIDLYRKWRAPKAAVVTPQRNDLENQPQVTVSHVAPTQPTSTTGTTHELPMASSRNRHVHSTRHFTSSSDAMRDPHQVRNSTTTIDQEPPPPPSQHTLDSSTTSPTQTTAFPCVTACHLSHRTYPTTYNPRTTASTASASAVPETLQQVLQDFIISHNTREPHDNTRTSGETSCAEECRIDESLPITDSITTSTPIPCA